MKRLQWWSRRRGGRAREGERKDEDGMRVGRQTGGKRQRGPASLLWNHKLTLEQCELIYFPVSIAILAELMAARLTRAAGQPVCVHIHICVLTCSSRAWLTSWFLWS